MQGLGHIVGTDSNDRTRQSNAYTFVGCIGQKVENAAAVYDKFNATVFELSVLQGVHSITNPLRPIDDPDPQHVAQIKSTALQTKDNGVGFLSDRVAVMLRTGYRRAHVFQKIFGANNQGLKELCSKLSPAWALLFSKSKDSHGVVWCTILGYGSNFDITGNLEYRAISWPSSSSSDSWRDVAADALFKSSYKDAPEQFFRSNGGKCWAPLANMREANKYFKQIEETGVLSLFPLGQPMQGEPRPTPTVVVTNNDINLQGDSLSHFLSKYFVHPDMKLLPDKYWQDAEYHGFVMNLKVQNKVVTCKPYMPDFPISNPVEIEIADGMHTMVYGPQSSKDHNSPDAPYAVDAGYKFWQQGYRTHLVSNSRIMNTEDLYRPEYDDDRRDYMEYVAKHAQRRMGQTLFARFENMCKGRDKEAVPDKYQELMDLVKEYEIFDSTNAYVTADKVYGKMMKNLLYLLGAPFEIFVRIDSKMPVNPAKDDIAKDTIMHAMFYGSIHIEIALDLLKRLGPALKARIAEIDKPSAASNSTARDTAADKGKGAQRDAAEQPAQAQTVKAKQKGGAKQNARAKQPAQTKAKERVNKKRPAPETKARRPNTRSRPNASSPSVASMPVRDPVNEAVGRLHELADEAERKRTHPTPSGSQGPMDSGDASSTRNKDAVRHTPRKHLPPRGAGNSHTRSTNRTGRASQGPAVSLDAKYGDADQLESIDACLQAGMKEVVGVVAQLATVKYVPLAEVLAEDLYSRLAYVVVETTECRKQLEEVWASRGLVRVDVLAYDQLSSYSGPLPDRLDYPPADCGEQARVLTLEACTETDPALPAPLPHEGAYGVGPSQAMGWPKGCLGYAFNLVRPKMPGLRQKVLAAVLGSTLVFATLDEAADYRRLVTQDYKLSMGCIITLNGRCITGLGVVMGDTFKPMPLSEAHYRFGTKA